MANYNIPDSPKMLRETLCIAQSRIASSPYDSKRKTEHIQRLQRLINECDRHRPLGIDGKHGNLHTNTCGCEDKGPASTWGTVMRLSAEVINNNPGDLITNYKNAINKGDN